MKNIVPKMLISSILNMKKGLKKVLCNLHNEVFKVAESRINTECSLTASEGVSVIHFVNRLQPCVPSLQVRVYRKMYRYSHTQPRSLTASEGVSFVGMSFGFLPGFPHCK